MLIKIIRLEEFRENFEKWRDFQYEVDPILRSSVDFLGKRPEEISEEAVLVSIVRDGKTELRKGN